MNTIADLEQQSLDLLDEVFDKCRGSAQVRINDSLPGYDRKRSEVFIKTYGEKTVWMPGRQFIKHLTPQQVDDLKHLPDWDGSNEVEVSSAVLGVLEGAIRSYQAF